MKFKDASVKTFELDFESISDFDLSFDSSSFVFRTLLRLVPNYSAEEINKMMETDDTYLATINNRALTPLNGLINSIIEPLFGATCLSLFRCFSRTAVPPSDIRVACRYAQGRKCG